MKLKPTLTIKQAHNRSRWREEKQEGLNLCNLSPFGVRFLSDTIFQAPNGPHDSFDYPLYYDPIYFLLKNASCFNTFAHGWRTLYELTLFCAFNVLLNLSFPCLLMAAVLLLSLPLLIDPLLVYPSTLSQCSIMQGWQMSAPTWLMGPCQVQWENQHDEYVAVEVYLKLYIYSWS